MLVEEQQAAPPAYVHIASQPMAATLPGLRRPRGTLFAHLAHESPPGKPAIQRRRLVAQSQLDLCSPLALAPHPGTRRRRAAAAAIPRRGTKLLAGCPRAAQLARPLRRRRGIGALESLRSQHQLRGRCRGPSRRAAVSGAGRGEQAGLLAAEADRGVQTVGPRRVRQQSDRNMTVCAHVCRLGAESGPRHVLLCVPCGQ